MDAFGSGLPAIPPANNDRANARKHMKTTIKPTDFRAALKLAILAYIKRAKAEGTTAMSAGCLKQCVNPPSRFLDGAPGFYGYPQMFGEVLAECGGRFVLADEAAR